MPDGTSLYLPANQYQQSNPSLTTGSSAYPKCADHSSLSTNYYGPTFAYGGDQVTFTWSVSLPANSTDPSSQCIRVLDFGCSFSTACSVTIHNPALPNGQKTVILTSEANGQPYPAVPNKTTEAQSLVWWQLTTNIRDNTNQPSGITTFEVTFQLADNAVGQFVSGSNVGPWAYMQGQNWGMAVPFNIGDSTLKPGEKERIRRRLSRMGGNVSTNGLACCTGDCPPKTLAAAEGSAMGGFVYNAANAAEAPQSPGYGWSMGADYARIAIESDDDDHSSGSSSPNYLDFYDGFGSFDRWTINNPGAANESYTPLYADMYTQAFKNADNTYSLVTQDLTMMTFHAWDGSVTQGKIASMADNNGNSVAYNYDPTHGYLTSVTDSDGHATYYDYGTRTDGQPMGIYSQVSKDNNGPQNTQFLYDSSGKMTQTKVNVQTVDGTPTNTNYSHQFAYDMATGQLASVTDPRGNVMLEYAYYGSSDAYPGLVKTETSYVQTALLPGQTTNPAPTGLKTMTYVYNFNSDNSGTIQITEQDLTDSTSLARVTLNTYNIRRQLIQSQVTVANAPGGVYTWTYEYKDTLSPYLLTKVTDPNLNTTSYTYDSLGNPTSMTDAKQQLTSYAYGTVTFQGVSVELLSVITPPAVTVNNVVQAVGYGATNLYYDPLGNLIQVVTPTDADNLRHITSYTRRSDGRITAITDRNGTVNGSTGHTSDVGNANGYNGNVTAISYTNAVAGSSNKGNISQIAFQSGQASPPTAPLSYINFTYDFYDNLLTVADPLGNSVANVWDSLNRLVKTQPLPPSQIAGQDYTKYVYVNEQLDHIDLPNNTVANNVSDYRRLVQFAYDVASRVSTLSGYPMPTAATPTEQLIAGYSYDAYDNIVSLTRLKRPNGSGPTPLSWNFQFDQLDRQVLATDTLQPTGRQTSTDYPHVCMAYTQTSPRGIATTYNFDALCRLIHIENNGEDDAISYDEWGRITQIQQLNGVRSEFSTTSSPEPAYFGKARFQDPRLQPTGMTWSFLYDALSRLTQVTYPDATTLVYTYDPEGNVLTVKDQNNNLTTYTYYPYPGYQLRSVSVTVASTTQTWAYAYDGAGRISQLSYPNGIMAKFSDTSNNPPQFGWDYKGQLLGINYVNSAGVTLQSFAYQYDNSGNRVSYTDVFNGSPASNTTKLYGYDGFNRLVSAGSNAYAYDESDNRMSATLNGTSYTYVVDGADQLQTRSSVAGTDNFNFDQDGNLLSRTLSGVTTTNTWDDKNKLTLIQGAGGSTIQSNTYDVQGLRRGTDPNITYYNSGSTSISDSRPSPANAVSFIQGHQILGFIANNAFYTYITDALGSVRHVMDSSGNFVYSFSYDEFGNASSVDRTGGNATLSGLCTLISFVGGFGVRNETATTGMLLMGQRWYSPDTGRFVSKDPIGFNGGLNLFGYVGQNPTGKIDPTGLSWWPWPASDPLGFDYAMKNGTWYEKTALVGLVGPGVIAGGFLAVTQPEISMPAAEEMIASSGLNTEGANFVYSARTAASGFVRTVRVNGCPKYVYNNTIYLGRAALRNTGTLMRTVAHETTHIIQAGLGMETFGEAADAPAYASELAPEVTTAIENAQNPSLLARLNTMFITIMDFGSQ